MEIRDLLSGIKPVPTNLHPVPFVQLPVGSTPQALESNVPNPDFFKHLRSASTVQARHHPPSPPRLGSIRSIPTLYPPIGIDARRLEKPTEGIIFLILTINEIKDFYHSGLIRVDKFEIEGHCYLNQWLINFFVCYNFESIRI